MGLGQTFSMGEKIDTGKMPAGAVVLIGLGVLFLLHTMGIFESGLDRFWPLILIFLGVLAVLPNTGACSAAADVCRATAAARAS